MYNVCFNNMHIAIILSHRILIIILRTGKNVCFRRGGIIYLVTYRFRVYYRVDTHVTRYNYIECVQHIM
jgi:hypothetical protein